MMTTTCSDLYDDDDDGVGCEYDGCLVDLECLERLGNRSARRV